jgi:hypothetical protein
VKSASAVKANQQPPPGSDLPGFFRPARALLAWLPPEQAHQLLVSGRGARPIGPDVIARARSAREFAAGRTPTEQKNVVMEPPKAIGDHLAAFRQSASNLFDEGFRICTVDLTRLYSLQPTTFTDHHVEQVAALDPTDTRGIAKITLPTETQVPMSVSHNPAQKTITLASPSLNLQVVSGEVEQSQAGFTVKLLTTCPTSVIQAAHFDGRYFCRDGHTRALQLLKRGITTVPAVVKEFSTYAEVAPSRNLLPEAVTRGSNPPTLGDFLDDRLSADVLLPMTRKVVVVTATEAELPV